MPASRSPSASPPTRRVGPFALALDCVRRCAAQWRRGAVYGASFLALALLAQRCGDHGLLWSATASLWTCLADPGGTARRRLLAMGLVAGGGAVVSVMGTAVAAAPAVALALALAAGLAAGMAEIRGPVAALCAKLLYVVLVAAMLQPAGDGGAAWWAATAQLSGLSPPWRAGIDFLVGGAVACLASLSLLPSERDARPRAELLAAFAALRRLAHLLDDAGAVASLVPDGDAINGAKRRIREALEQAEQAVHARRGWVDPDGLLQYRYLVAMADALFGLLIVAAELRARPGHGAVPWRHLSRSVADLHAQLAEGLQGHNPDLPALARSASVQLRRLHGPVANAGAPPLYQAALASLARFPAFEAWRSGFHWPRPSLWLLVRQCRLTLIEHLAQDARVSRHALRLALAGTLSLLPAHLLQMNHGYWVAVTVIMVLTPRLQTTRSMSMQRFAGSVAGALLGCGLALVLPSSGMAVVASALCLSIAYAGRLAGSIGVFALMLTPAVILLSWVGEPATQGSHLAVLRGMDTAIGCVIALGSYALLSHRAETSRARRYAREAIAVHAVYLRAAFALSLQPASSPQAEVRLEALRIAAGRASVRSEQCLEQVQAELDRDAVAAFEQLHHTLRRMAALAGLLRAEVAFNPGGDPAGPSLSLNTLSRVGAARQRLATLAVRPGSAMQDAGEAVGHAEPVVDGDAARDASTPGARDQFLLEQAALAMSCVQAVHQRVQAIDVVGAARPVGRGHTPVAPVQAKARR